MTNEEFNKKYQSYLKEGYYGLSIDLPELTKELDILFQEFIQHEGFSYSQIKLKFGYGRFYCEGLPAELINKTEDIITVFCNK